MGIDISVYAQYMGGKQTILAEESPEINKVPDETQVESVFQKMAGKEHKEVAATDIASALGEVVQRRTISTEDKPPVFTEEQRLYLKSQLLRVVQEARGFKETGNDTPFIRTLQELYSLLKS